MAQADVFALLPLITPFSAPADTVAGILYGQAHNRALNDAPGATGEDLILMETYYVAFLLANKDGGLGLTSEKLDDAAFAYSGGGRANGYLAQYRDLAAKVNAGATVTAADLATEQIREDTLDGLNLDAETISFEDDEDEFL